MRLTLREGIDPYTNRTVWLMLDEDYEIVEPIQRYLTSLSTSRSPNTVKAYGSDLKMWWAYLGGKNLDWRNVNLHRDLADFAYWLRVGQISKVIAVCKEYKDKNVLSFKFDATTFWELVQIHFVKERGRREQCSLLLIC